MSRIRHIGDNRIEESRLGDKIFLTDKEGREVFIYVRNFLNSPYVSNIITTIASGGGLTSVATDSSINGDGTPGSPLNVANPFPGFTSLVADYGVTLATVATSGDYNDLINTPTSFDGNGIMDSGNDGAAIAVSSLSLSGSLNIDSNTFVIDGLNGRVGIGIAAPTSDFHIKFPDSLGTSRGVNIQHPTQNIIGVQHNGNIGLGVGPTNGGPWIEMISMADPLIGVDFTMKSSAVGTKTALNLRSDNSTTDSSFTFIKIDDARNNGTFSKLGLYLDIKSGGGTGTMKAIQVFNGISLMRDVETQTGDAYYIGPSGTNGSWRIMQSGDDLIFQQREAGVWNTKNTISGA